MRPAYRYAVASLVALLLIAGGVWWWRAPVAVVPPPLPLDPHQEPLPLRPEGLDPMVPPIVGRPSAREQAELLDRLEAYETQQHGATEAGRRRRAREQMMRARVQDPPEPAGP